MVLKKLLFASVLALASGDAFAQEAPQPIADPLPLVGYTLDMMKPHLDWMALVAKREIGSQAFVLVYGGRDECEGEAARRAEWARRYLSRRHGLSGERVKVVVGGYRAEREMELFVRGAGWPEPEATPDLDVRQEGLPSGRCQKRAGRSPRRRA